MGLLVLTLPRPAKPLPVGPSREDRIRAATRSVRMFVSRKMPTRCSVAYDETGVIVHPDADPAAVTRAALGHLRAAGKVDAGLDVEKIARPPIERRFKAISGRA